MGTSLHPVAYYPFKYDITANKKIKRSFIPVQVGVRSFHILHLRWFIYEECTCMCSNLCSDIVCCSPAFSVNPVLIKASCL